MSDINIEMRSLNPSPEREGVQLAGLARQCLNTGRPQGHGTLSLGAKEGERPS